MKNKFTVSTFDFSALCEYDEVRLDSRSSRQEIYHNIFFFLEPEIYKKLGASASPVLELQIKNEEFVIISTMKAFHNGFALLPYANVWVRVQKFITQNNLEPIGTRELNLFISKHCREV